MASEKVSSVLIGSYMGSLFGALFGGLYALVGALAIDPWWPMLPAAALAGGAVAAFSSALRIGVIGFFLGVACSLVIIIITGTDLKPPLHAIVGMLVAGFGLGLSALFFPFPKTMLTKTLTGFTVAFLSAAGLTLLCWPFSAIPVLTLCAATIALMASIAYRMVITRMDKIVSRHTPAALAAALTAGGFGSMGALSMWAIAIGVDPEADPELVDLAINALRCVVFGAIGGVMGGSLSGILALLRTTDRANSR